VEFTERMNKISIIEVKGLTKVFNGSIRAVDGISFSVNEGEILGFLGPNGAGKTTTLNMLSTLLRPSDGSATVNGHDIVKKPDNVRRSIGYVFQDPTLDLELTGRENLDFHGRLYHLDGETRQARIKEMLEVVQLSSRADDLVKTYSGGMKRRLEIARGLLHHPKVLFLDEPTLGLDPQTRRSIWDHVQRLNEDSKITIILTTHYTEEADFLSDRILIIDLGKIVALDTPEKLKARLKGDVVSLAPKNPETITKMRSLFKKKEWVRNIDIVSSASIHSRESGAVHMTHRMAAASEMSGSWGEVRYRGGGAEKSGNGNQGFMQDVKGEKDSGDRAHDWLRLNLVVDDGAHRIPEIVKIADEAGVALDSVELREPTLDDVFLSFTGRGIRDEKGSFTEMARRFNILRQARGRQGRR
jgi:ABC-2 type transport system ATP-binding protein